MTPWTSKVGDQSTNRWGFWPKNWTCLIFFVGQLEAYLVGDTNRSDRPNMSISTNLSVTSRWAQYNAKMNCIDRPINEFAPPDQYFVYVPLVGRCMPLVGVIRRPVESALQSVQGASTTSFRVLAFRERSRVWCKISQGGPSSSLPTFWGIWIQGYTWLSEC